MTVGFAQFLRAQAVGAAHLSRSLRESRGSERRARTKRRLIAMTVRGVPAPVHVSSPALYWEDRAQRFAGEARRPGRGVLPTACRSSTIARSTWSSAWRSRRGCDVRAGHPRARCGLRRRPLEPAAGRARRARDGRRPEPDHDRRGAAARRRRRASPTAAAFWSQDLADLDVGEEFDLVLGVTVLQHILDPAALRAALAAHGCASRPGRPHDPARGGADRRVERLRYDGVHGARTATSICRCSRECGLELRALTGVDPAPFRDLAAAAPAAAARARCRSPRSRWRPRCRCPIDALFGRRAVQLAPGMPCSCWNTCGDQAHGALARRIAGGHRRLRVARRPGRRSGGGTR